METVSFNAKCIETNPQALEILLRGYKNGDGVQEIADRLNNMGFRTQRNFAIDNSTVSYLAHKNGLPRRLIRKFKALPKDEKTPQKELQNPINKKAKLTSDEIIDIAASNMSRELKKKLLEGAGF